MLVEVESPSPPPAFPSPGSVAALAALSRNASVISSSSSSSSSSSLLLNTVRPGPLRTFTSPRARSPTPATATPTRPPLYLSRVPKSRSNSAAARLGPDDFEFGDVLGEGSYSTVMAAVYPPHRKTYAIKVLDKEHLVRKNMARIVNVERNVLVRLREGPGHPGIVRMHWAFQDQWSFYLVLDLVPQGELQTRISRLGSLALPCARWYAAQLIDTTAWMHARGVIHRDLKPENVLLDAEMRIKVTDFGSAKICDAGEEDDRSNSWVGTPQYVPPELLLDNTMCKSSDFWAIGCILYQMISGTFPFTGASNYLMWVKVKTLDYAFPAGFDPAAQDLVRRLLVLDPAARLGTGPPASAHALPALRAHPFFAAAQLPWEQLWSARVPPLEAGLVRRGGGEGAGKGKGGGAFDVGEEWERMVGEGEGEGGEELEDGVGAGLGNGNGNGHALNGLEDPTPPPDPRNSPPTESRLTGLLDSLTLARARSRRPSTSTAPATPRPRRPSISTRSRRPSTSTHTRTQTPSPPPRVPFADAARWRAFLRAAETPVFVSCVCKAARRFPRMQMQMLGGMKGEKVKTAAGDNAKLKAGAGAGETTKPKPAAGDKKKVRLLVLTRTRLLCLKETPGDGGVVLKSEVLIGGQGGGGGVGVVTGVTGGVERGVGFVVHTVSKDYSYTTEDAALAARWAQEIGDALPPPASVDVRPGEAERTRSS